MALRFKFEYYQSSKDSNWYWRLKSGNGQIMADSGEGYSSKQACERAIATVKSNMGRAQVIEVGR